MTLATTDMLLQAPRANLSDTAAAGIRAEIASGRWAVGSRIPIEPQLALMLGVGRGTVREAVRTLDSYHFAFNKLDIISIHATSGGVDEGSNRWRQGHGGAVGGTAEES
jgi:DNA-binding transcriptional MocR family regulator